MDYCGIKPIDYMLNGLRPGAFVQFVSNHNVELSWIALNIANAFDSGIVYFDINKSLNLGVAKNIFGPKLKEVYVVSKNGNDALSILKILTAIEGIKIVIFDDISSFVSNAEQGGNGDELDTIEQLSRAMITVREHCRSNGIRMIWLNRVKYSEKNGTSVYGGKYILHKIPLTVLFERLRLIKMQKNIGYEYVASVIESDIRFSGRSTTIPIMDYVINTPLWIFNESRKHNIIKDASGVYRYRNTDYGERDLFNLIKSDSKVADELLLMIDVKWKKWLGDS
ncbi:MAG: hypothetical protein WCY30_01665 [Candidatus Neomarinimicrobiota bacterium]|jgi:RecA/RadA recombinase